MNDLIDGFQMSYIDRNIADEALCQFIKLIGKNCSLILNFNKIIIDNVFSQQDCHLDEEEINNLIFEIESSIDRGNFSLTSLTYVEEETKEYIAFDIDSSFKVDLNQTRDLKIKIKNNLTNEVLFEQIINIRSKFHNIFLENLFYHGFDFDYKGACINGIVSFLMVFIPRNLETAHLILHRELMEENFQKFSGLIKNVECINEFRQLFLSQSYKEKYTKNVVVDFRYYLNRSLDRITCEIRNLENKNINALKPQNYEELAAILKTTIRNDFGSLEFLTETAESMEQGL